MVDTVQTIPVPRDDQGALRAMLNPRSNRNTTGFQRAHVLGRKFINDNIMFLADLWGPNGADDALNGVLLPEGNRGGITVQNYGDSRITVTVHLIDGVKSH